MPDALLPYFNSELAAIRKLAGEFAVANPKVASRLRMTADVVDDPHVERLLEGVAFLAARVQHRLDDELPELSDALLELLAPHLLAPVPSMTTIKLMPEAGGHRAVAASRVTHRCRRSRCVASRCSTAPATTTVLWPVAIETGTPGRAAAAAPANPHAPRAVAVPPPRRWGRPSRG